MPLGWSGGHLGVLPPPCGFRLEPLPVPLDEFLPHYDANEVHSTRVAAPPDEVMAALRSLTAREVPVLVALMALRSLPAVLTGRRRRPRRGTVLEGFLRGGFVLLAERPTSRWWAPSGASGRRAPTCG